MSSDCPSVCPSEAWNTLSTCTWVHWSDCDCFVACLSVGPSVRILSPYLPHWFGGSSVTCLHWRKWRCFLGMHDARVWGTIDCVLHLVVVIGLVCVQKIFLPLLMGCWYRERQHCTLLKRVSFENGPRFCSMYRKCPVSWRRRVLKIK